MINPFESGVDGGCVRLACQIVHLDRMTGGTMVDLVAMEPFEWSGGRMESGTPLTLAFATVAPEAQAELDATLRPWERDGDVLHLAIDELPAGLRYSFAAGGRQLVLTVDSSG